MQFWIWSLHDILRHNIQTINLSLFKIEASDDHRKIRYKKYELFRLIPIYHEFLRIKHCWNKPINWLYSVKNRYRQSFSALVHFQFRMRCLINTSGKKCAYIPPISLFDLRVWAICHQWLIETLNWESSKGGISIEWARAFSNSEALTIWLKFWLLWFFI